MDTLYKADTTAFPEGVRLIQVSLYIYVNIFIIVFYLPFYCNIRYVVLSFDERKTHYYYYYYLHLVTRGKSIIRYVGMLHIITGKHYRVKRLAKLIFPRKTQQCYIWVFYLSCWKWPVNIIISTSYRLLTGTNRTTDFDSDIRRQNELKHFPLNLVCYTAVFSVTTQRSSPLTAAENRATFLYSD